MNVLTFDTEEQIGIAAGYYMCGQVLQKPDSVLGLATGSTPLKPYAHMIKLYQDGAVDFSKVTTFNLDEYCNLDVKDKNSYHSFMYENLFDHINIPDENINFLRQRLLSRRMPTVKIMKATVGHQKMSQSNFHQPHFRAFSDIITVLTVQIGSRWTATHLL